jgi:hypothetical protein
MPLQNPLKKLILKKTNVVFIRANVFKEENFFIKVKKGII